VIAVGARLVGARCVLLLCCRWGPQAAHRGMPPDRGAGPGNMQPAVFAAAAAAGNKLACGIDNLAGSLQGNYSRYASKVQRVSASLPALPPSYWCRFSKHSPHGSINMAHCASVALSAQVDLCSQHVCCSIPWSRACMLTPCCMGESLALRALSG
jgi:hypothetical protein